MSPSTVCWQCQSPIHEEFRRGCCACELRLHDDCWTGDYLRRAYAGEVNWSVCPNCRGGLNLFVYDDQITVCEEIAENQARCRCEPADDDT